VRVVDHDHCAVFVGQAADLREMSQVAIHRKDSIRRDEAKSGSSGSF
jgi:hypothetical protein